MKEKPKVKMVALQRTYYAGQWHNEGEEFEIKPQYVNLLTKTKRAAVVETKREYKRRDLRAES